MIVAQTFSRNNRFYIQIGLASLVIGVLFLYFIVQKPSTETVTTPFAYLSKENSRSESGEKIFVSIAETPEERTQGLSNTEVLPPDSGMLFIFEHPGIYGFWMKDMNYGLDIVWMNSSFEIVGITSDVKPSTYPELLYPPVASMYVLEVPAGFAQTHSIEVGQSFTLHK